MIFLYFLVCVCVCLQPCVCQSIVPAAPAKQCHQQQDLLAWYTCSGCHPSITNAIFNCLKARFRSGKLTLNSRQRARTALGNNLVIDDCDPPLGRLRRVDSWMDRAKRGKESEGGRGVGWRKTWYSENHSNFSSALRPAGAQGNNKRLLQPLFLFPGYNEAKPSKNSATVFLCVCVCVRTG